MDRSPKQLQELTLALLYLTSLQDHDDPAGRRCWKGCSRIPKAAFPCGCPRRAWPGHRLSWPPWGWKTWSPGQNNQNRPFRRAQLRRKGRFLPGVQMRPSCFTDRIRCKFSPGPHL